MRGSSNRADVRAHPLDSDHNLKGEALKRLLLASMTLAFVVPGAALAKQPTAAHRAQYQRAYRAVVRVAGHRAPGRNIVSDGTSRGAATDAQVVKSLAVLERMLAPPPPVASFSSSGPVREDFTSSTPSRVCGGSTPYPGGGDCWAIPYSIVLCESHGQNVPNSKGSGAHGYYQLMKGGTGSRQEQDQAAAALWNGGVNSSNGAGPRNWTCK